MPIVNFVNEKKQVQAPVGANLRKVALEAGIPLYNGINGYGAKVNAVLNCHGLGHCGTCRVLIAKGMENTSPPSTMEKITRCVVNPINPIPYFAFIGNEETMRLACCTKVIGDIDVVTRPEFNIAGENFFS